MLLRTFCIALGLVFSSTIVDCRNANNQRFWWLFPEFDTEATSKPTREIDDSFLRVPLQDTEGQRSDDWDSPAEALKTALDFTNQGVDDSWNQSDEATDQNSETAVQINDAHQEITNDELPDIDTEDLDDWDTDESGTGSSQTEIYGEETRVEDRSADAESIQGPDDGTEEKEQTDGEINTDEYLGRRSYQNEEATEGENTVKDEEPLAFVLDIDTVADQEDEAEGSAEDSSGSADKKDDEKTQEFVIDFGSETADPKKSQDEDPDWSKDDQGANRKTGLADQETDNVDQGSGQGTNDQTWSGRQETSVDDEDWSETNSQSQVDTPAEAPEGQEEEDSDEADSDTDTKDDIVDPGKGLSSWDEDDTEANSDDLDNNESNTHKVLVEGVNPSPEVFQDAKAFQNISDFSGDGLPDASDDDDDEEEDDETVLPLESARRSGSDVKGELDESADEDQEPLYLSVNSESNLGRNYQQEFDAKLESKETEDEDRDFSDFNHGTVDTSDDYGGLFKLIDEKEVNAPKTNDLEEILKELETNNIEPDDRPTSGDGQPDPSVVNPGDIKAESEEEEDLPEDIVDEEIIVSDDDPDFDPGYNLRCDPFYDPSGFNVTVSSPAMVEHNSSVSLECVVVGQDNFRPLTLVTKWEFRQPSCGDEDNSCALSIHEESFSVHCDPLDKSCTTLDYKTNSTRPNFTSALSIKEAQHNQTGLYRCIVYATGCTANRTITIDAHQAAHITVYRRANYTAHVAIMTVTCVLLLALLLGLTFLMRRVMKRHRDNYRLIIADTNIQYQPIKALELPPTGVFMNTTVAITRHSIASSFSSKSSFVSAEEAA